MEAKTIHKYQNKSHPWLMVKARETVHRYVRLRDSYPNHVLYKERYFKCIACGKVKGTKQMQAGHYYSAGEYTALKFNLSNVNGECIHCNYYSGDHLIKYSENLIKKIGQEEFNKLEFWAGQTRHKTCKYERFTLIDIIEETNKKINVL